VRRCADVVWENVEETLVAIRRIVDGSRRIGND
jgi:hypothetical protein